MAKSLTSKNAADQPFENIALSTWDLYVILQSIFKLLVVHVDFYILHNIAVKLF